MTAGPESKRFAQFKVDTHRKLQGVYCPEHHKPPRLKIHGHSLHDATLSLSGCCDKLMAIANEAIAGARLEGDECTAHSAHSAPTSGIMK